jgi:cyanate permease
MDDTTSAKARNETLAASGTGVSKAEVGFGVATTCIVLVALDLRPGLVSVGPLLPSVRDHFHLSHTIAALLTIQRPTGLHRIPWGDRKAWLIAIYFGCQNFIFYSVISWIVPIFVEQGEPTTRAGFILATFTLVFTPLNPVYGAFSRSLDRRGWLALSGASTVAGVTALAFIPVISPFIDVSVVAFGLAGAFMLGMTLPLDNTRKADEAAAWNAFVLMTGYVIAACGPLFVGMLRGQTNDFRWSTRLLLGVAVAMLAFAPFLHPKMPCGGQILLGRFNTR